MLLVPMILTIGFQLYIRCPVCQAYGLLYIIWKYLISQKLLLAGIKNALLEI